MGVYPNEKSHLLPIKYPVRRLSTPPSSQGKELEVPDLGKKRSHSDKARIRTRTISYTEFNFRGDESVLSTVSTSYGPVVISDSTVPGYGGCWGIILAALSGVLFTANNFFFQYLGLNVTDMLLSRSAMQTVVLGMILVVTGGCSSCVPVRCMDWVLVISQALFSGARVGLTFACLEFLPLGDALTIIFSEPLWTIIFAKMFLKTRIGLWKFAFAVVLLAGVILCTQPPLLFAIPDDKSLNQKHHHHHHHHHRHHHHEHYHSSPVKLDVANETITDSLDIQDDDYSYFFGVLLAVGAAITGSGSNVIVAKCEEMSSIAMVTYSGLGGILLALVYGLSVDPDDKIVSSFMSVTAEEWLPLLLLGAMGLVGFFALTRSLQLIPPTTVAVLRALEIVLAYGIQAAVFGEVPNSLELAGSSLVIISVGAFALENVFMKMMGID